ncbi:MAG: trehalose-phosphatase [Intrasporangium sp.]|uniref:trehalose-phosphatase n=1 Tax=Intrasporangium sp. TaxID=1925024 RepID=UPI003F81D9DF
MTGAPKDEGADRRRDRPDAALATALDSAATAEPLLVATDFDGVIAPFNPDPLAVQPTAGVMQTLGRLARLPHLHIALVSGRDLTTLRLLTGLTPDDPITLIGSHGAESTNPAVRAAMESASVTADDLARLDSLEVELRELVTTRHPEARVERKTAGVALHTRGLAEAVARPALEEARSLGQSQQGVRVLEGKSVLELSVSAADKGSALVALSRTIGPTARVYLGDDVTDEDVFARFEAPGDVTVKVGPGSTAARYRVTDTDAVASLLGDLLTRRTASERRG